MNRFLLAALLSLLVISGFKCESQKNYYYEPEESKLTGSLALKSFYGAPGYGEDTVNDAKENVYVLQLSTPIDVDSKIKDEINTPEKNITEVQLQLNGDLEKYKEFMN